MLWICLNYWLGNLGRKLWAIPLTLGAIPNNSWKLSSVIHSSFIFLLSSLESGLLWVLYWTSSSSIWFIWTGCLEFNRWCPSELLYSLPPQTTVLYLLYTAYSTNPQIEPNLGPSMLRGKVDNEKDRDDYRENIFKFIMRKILAIICQNQYDFVTEIKFLSILWSIYIS